MVSYPYRDRICEAVQRRLPESQVSGYHGTSIFAVLEAARSGYLPNRFADMPLFYYLPADLPGARDEARQYAQDHARFHFTREFLEVPSIEDVFRKVERGNRDVEALLRHLSQEREMLGVLLSLGPSIHAFPEETDPARRSNERCVKVPHSGLSIKHVASIQPLGDFDREVLAESGLS